MASKNVRVDSLFLDEGFGTLDEEVLDTAMEFFSGSQQDGKLIGVISHVPALKEQISTSDPSNASNRWQKPDIWSWMRQDVSHGVTNYLESRQSDAGGGDDRSVPVTSVKL